MKKYTICLIVYVTCLSGVFHLLQGASTSSRSDINQKYFEKLSAWVIDRLSRSWHHDVGLTQQAYAHLLEEKRSELHHILTFMGGAELKKIDSDEALKEFIKKWDKGLKSTPKRPVPYDYYINRIHRSMSHIFKSPRGYGNELIQEYSKKVERIKELEDKEVQAAPLTQKNTVLEKEKKSLSFQRNASLGVAGIAAFLFLESLRDNSFFRRHARTTWSGIKKLSAPLLGATTK